MRFVIDVTQLIHWNGNLTGIPRVMDELAIRFLEEKSSETVFVSWVKEIGQMCEVHFSKSRTHRGTAIYYVKKAQENESESIEQAKPEFTTANNVTIIGKKVVKRIIAKSRLDQTKLYKKSIDTKRAIEVRQYKVYTPQANDAFFIPWGEWWDKNWLALVQDYAKKSVNIYPVSHDILPMIVPQFSGNSASLADFVSKIFPIAKAVITVSESTKKDLTNWMTKQGLPVPTIKVFRLGEDFSISKLNLDDKELSTKYSVQIDDYIIFVSTIEPRKNHTLLYYTYKLAISRGVKLPKLLIIGRVGHDVSEIIKLIKNDPQIHQSISIENNVSDNDLNWLYENCKFTVNSSFYEGWGMPVIESIAHGKPAAISNTSSFLEMPDDCVIRFNPTSTDECLSAIEALSNPITLEKYREQAKNYRSHSWDESFIQVKEILEEKNHA